MSTQELVKISKRFIGRVKFTSQDLDHFSHTYFWIWTHTVDAIAYSYIYVRHQYFLIVYNV